MLRLRVISALIAAPLALSAIFFLPLPWFALVFLTAASLALYEWGGIAGLRPGLPLNAYLVSYWLLASLLWFSPSAAYFLLLSAVVFWGWACYSVLRFPSGSSALRRGWFTSAIGLLVFLSAWQSLVSLKALPQGAWLLIWIFVLVWGTDIGGYFIGRAWGRNKLATRVSPGKTWEGAWGGAALALAVTLAMAIFLSPYRDFGLATWLWLLMAMFLIALSIMGDLFESVLKRVSGVKDSGGIMPGHGGLLDRVDALIAVLPLFALMMAFWLGSVAN